MEKDFDYAIKFCEHEASGTWDDRKHRIAEYAALCLACNDPEEAWKKYSESYEEKLASGTRFVDDRDCMECFDDGGGFVLRTSDEWICDGRGMETLNQGMQKWFPDIDYECQMGVQTDDLYYVDISIVKDGKAFSGGYAAYDLIDYLEQNASEEFLEKINEEVKTKLTPEDFSNLEEECMEPWVWYLTEQKSDLFEERIIQELIANDRHFDTTATEDNPFSIPQCVLFNEHGDGFFPPVPDWFSFPSV